MRSPLHENWIGGLSQILHNSKYLFLGSEEFISRTEWSYKYELYFLLLDTLTECIDSVALGSFYMPQKTEELWDYYCILPIF